MMLVMEDQRVRSELEAVVSEGFACELEMICPICLLEMQPEHAHFRCSRCGYRDSCCF